MAAAAPASVSRAASTRLELTPETLQVFAPDIAAQYRQALIDGNEVLTRYAINLTPLRFCHFMAQIRAVSGRMTVLEEHLGYRSAALVKAAWPTRFRTVASAEPYVNEPQRLADRVYGDRFDNQHGDGWRYRGRGLAQITGRSNYREMGEKLGIPLEQHPQLALDPKYALVIACETWADLQNAGERDMNKLADGNKLEALTYRMTGSFTDLDDRRSAFEQAWQIWASGDPPRRMLDTDVLDRGDRGGRVDELNSRLKEFGLFAGITPEPPQHIYTGCTYEAVRVLQAETGLPETGVVGPETWGVLDKAVERGLVTRGKGAVHEADAASQPSRNPLSRRFAELRFWSVGLAILALLYIVGHMFLLTHPTGNAVLWTPMLFGAAVFVAGLALWLAARPHPHWQVPSRRPVTRTLSRGRPTTFLAGDEEPVRIGTNL